MKGAKSHENLLYELAEVSSLTGPFHLSEARVSEAVPSARQHFALGAHRFDHHARSRCGQNKIEVSLSTDACRCVLASMVPSVSEETTLPMLTALSGNARCGIAVILAPITLLRGGTSRLRSARGCLQRSGVKGEPRSRQREF